MKQQEKLIMETVTDYVKQKEMAMSKAEEPADTVRLERPSDLERESISALSNGEIVPCHTTGVGCDAEKISPLNDALSDAENILFHDGETDKSNVVRNNISNAKPIEILGDNIDVTITPAKMTIEKQRKSLHWFLTMAKQKRITAADGMDLATTEKCDILQMPTCSWLPTMEQLDSLRENIVFHVAHILLKYVEFLKPASVSFPKYIPHPYLDKTKEKSVFLNCDLIEASENSSQGKKEY